MHSLYVSACSSRDGRGGGGERVSQGRCWCSRWPLGSPPGPPKDLLSTSVISSSGTEGHRGFWSCKLSGLAIARHVLLSTGCRDRTDLGGSLQSQPALCNARGNSLKA